MCLKELDYVMSMMTTYGTLLTEGALDRSRSYIENGNKQQKTIHYLECITNHFKYRDSVDANNRDQMYPVALEETWKTTRWPCRVFQFLLAVTEVNVRRAAARICKTVREDISQQEFRKALAKELIYNNYLSPDEEDQHFLRSNNPQAVEHWYMSVPRFHTIGRDGALQPCKTEWIQKLCECGKKVRKYCSCTPMIF